MNVYSQSFKHVHRIFAPSKFKISFASKLCIFIRDRISYIPPIKLTVVCVVNTSRICSRNESSYVSFKN